MGLLHPFQERPTHINYFSFYNLNYESLLDLVPKTLNPHSPRVVNNHTVHPHPTRRDVTLHMNAMMPIHISNSYGSHIIIFHIIQSLMLTHQFSMHQHVIFHTIHAIQFKQIHMDIFDPTSTSGLFLTVPHQSVGCPWTAPFIKNGHKHQTHMIFIFHHNIKQFHMDTIRPK